MAKMKSFLLIVFHWDAFSIQPGETICNIINQTLKRNLQNQVIKPNYWPDRPKKWNSLFKSDNVESPKTQEYQQMNGLHETLSQAWLNIQSSLFPWLSEKLGPLTAKQQELVIRMRSWSARASSPDATCGIRENRSCPKLNYSPKWYWSNLSIICASPIQWINLFRNKTGEAWIRPVPYLLHMTMFYRIIVDIINMPWKINIIASTQNAIASILHHSFA